MPGTDFSPLEQTLTNLTNAADAIVALVQQFAADVTAHAGDQAKVTQLAADYSAQAQRLADAAVVNTSQA